MFYTLGLPVRVRKVPGKDRPHEAFFVGENGLTKPNISVLRCLIMLELEMCEASKLYLHTFPVPT